MRAFDAFYKRYFEGGAFYLFFCALTILLIVALVVSVILGVLWLAVIFALPLSIIGNLHFYASLHYDHEIRARIEEMR